MSQREPPKNLANLSAHLQKEIERVKLKICARNGWTDEQRNDFMVGLKKGEWKLKIWRFRL